MNRYPLEYWAELVLAYLAHVPHQESENTYVGFYCPSIIDQREARQQKDGSY
jgi:hypothetical protein